MSDDDVEDAAERAYALGVRAAIDSPPTEELESLMDAAESSYERTLIELAYDEGRTEAREYRSREDASDEETWSVLVEGVDPPEEEEAIDRALPRAVSRMEALEFHDREVDAVRLPDFLFGP